MARYVTREGDLTTISVWADLTACGPETRGSIIVPPGCNAVKQILVGVGGNVFTDVKGCLIAGKLSGGGMMGQDYEFFAGGINNGTATGNDTWSGQKKSFILDTNLAVAPGGEIYVKGALVTNDDSGTANMGVTLVFGSGGSRRNSYARYNSGVDAVNTKYSATVDPVNATVNSITLPSTAKRITNISVACGGEGGGATAGGGTAIIRLEGGMPEGDVVLTAGGFGTESDTVGQAGSGVCVADSIPTDIAVVGGGVVNVYVEMAGLDWGTMDVGVSVEVEY